MTSATQAQDTAFAAMPDEVRVLDESAQKRFTPCGAGKIAWRIWGEGDPVVMFHGGSGSWTHWIRNIPELSKHYRLIVADLPGLGDSTSPPRPFDNDDMPGSMTMLADIMRTGIDELLGGQTPYRLVGFSFGSILAGHMAAGEGRRLKSLTLVGSAALGLPRKPLPGELMRVPRGASVAEGIEIQWRNLSIHMLSAPERVDDLAAWLQWRNLQDTRVRGRRVAPTDLLAKALPKIGAPVDGIWGGLDAYAPPRIGMIGELLQSHQPGARFEVIDDAGHWVMYEKPAEFNATLLDVLAGRAG